MHSRAFFEFFEDLEEPKGTCFAHALLYAYVECYPEHGHTLPPTLQGLQNIDKYRNRADLALSRITRHCTDWLYQELAYVPERGPDVPEQCVELAECIMEYVRPLLQCNLPRLIKRCLALIVSCNPEL